jgi:hypothetical protein
MKVRSSRSMGKVGQAFSRLGVLGGAGACGALLFRLPGVGGIGGAWLFPTLFIVAAVIGIMSSSRVQARRRWKAAWDAYAELEMSREPIPATAEQEPVYSWAGAH